MSAKKYILFTLVFTIASISAVRISRNGIIERNEDPASLIITDNANFNKTNTFQSSRAIRIKFCQTCHLDTHYTGESVKFCNKCNGTDHCSVRSNLCKYSRTNIIQDENHQRLCSDCGRDDHLSKKSNLCPHNNNSIINQSTSLSNRSPFNNEPSLPTIDGKFFNK